MTDFQLLLNKSIKNLRLSKNLTQEAFSEKCGLSSVDNYRNIEYNRHTPKSDTIDKICKTFEINPIELLSYGLSANECKSAFSEVLNGLNDDQLSLVLDFIQLLKNRNY